MYPGWCVPGPGTVPWVYPALPCVHPQTGRPRTESCYVPGETTEKKETSGLREASLPWVAPLPWVTLPKVVTVLRGKTAGETGRHRAGTDNDQIATG